MKSIFISLFICCLIGLCYAAPPISIQSISLGSNFVSRYNVFSLLSGKSITNNYLDLVPPFFGIYGILSTSDDSNVVKLIGSQYGSIVTYNYIVSNNSMIKTEDNIQSGQLSFAIGNVPFGYDQTNNIAYTSGASNGYIAILVFNFGNNTASAIQMPFTRAAGQSLAGGAYDQSTNTYYIYYQGQVVVHDLTRSTQHSYLLYQPLSSGFAYLYIYNSMLFAGTTDSQSQNDLYAIDIESTSAKLVLSQPAPGLSQINLQPFVFDSQGYVIILSPSQNNQMITFTTYDLNAMNVVTSVQVANNIPNNSNKIVPIDN